MVDREQTVRERAHKIWEDEGRVDGSHGEHWKRAEEHHELTEQESEDVTKVNQEADKPIANPAADGTTQVEEPANDWPAADRP